LILIASRQEASYSIGNLFKFSSSDKQQLEIVSSVGDLQTRSNLIMANIISADKPAKIDIVNLTAMLTQIKDLNQLLDQSKNPNQLQNLNRLGPLARRIEQSLGKIISRNEVTINIHQHADAVLALIPNMLAKNDELVSVLVSNNVDSGTIYVATRQMMLLERIRNNIVLSLNFNADKSITAADRYGRDASILLRIYKNLHTGSKQLRIKKVENEPAQKILADLILNYDEISKNIGAMLDRAPDYFQVQMSMQDFIAENRELMTLVADIQKNELSNM